jgi:hypothetical protein
MTYGCNIDHLLENQDVLRGFITEVADKLDARLEREGEVKLGQVIESSQNGDMEWPKGLETPMVQ